MAFILSTEHFHVFKKWLFLHFILESVEGFQVLIITQLIRSQLREREKKNRHAVQKNLAIMSQCHGVTMCSNNVFVVFWDTAI